MDERLAVRTVEKRWGSMEELVYTLVTESPHLLEQGVDAVAGELGLPRELASWLLHSSKEFRSLLDSHVAASVWTAAERREAYQVLADRARSPKERLGETVRAMEYLDAKAGLEKDRPRSPQVAVQIVQEGDGSWETDYEGLEFGGKGHGGAHPKSRAYDVEVEQGPVVEGGEGSSGGADS